MRHTGIIFLGLATIGSAGAQELIDPASLKPATPSSSSSISNSSSSISNSSSSISSTLSYTPPTGEDRVNWAIKSTIGPASLAGGLFSAGWGTEFNRPSEYGTHWDGFAQRYGLRLSGIASSNAVEAGLGAAWGEDPRYFREPDRPFGHRLLHAATMTFFAKDRTGNYMPAYARYTAIVGTNYLSNTWRPDSDATGERASLRIGLGFLGRFSGNVWEEFWPDMKNHVFHHNRQDDNNR